MHIENLDKFQPELNQFIERAFAEDIGSGDHTSLACIPAEKKAKAVLKVKDEGVLAGVSLARHIFHFIDPEIQFHQQLSDGDEVKSGMQAFVVEGKLQHILMAERLVLNCMQRMSGIATRTKSISRLIEDTPAKLLDTRKTTPGIRFLEKWAVRIGGGHNHRFGLFDMIMIKDNHVDGAGGINEAITAVRNYLQKQNLDLKIEVETRNMQEVQQVLNIGGIHRIMLDNFSPELMKEAVELIGGRYETEASGGITEANIREYALTGVDFISTSAITHSVKSMDLSLKVAE